MRIPNRGNVRLIILFSLIVFTVCFIFQDAFCNRCEDKYINVPKPTPFDRWNRRVTKSLAELSRVPELSDHIMMFNRIPKSGSEIFVFLLQKLQGNSFRHIRLGEANPRRLSHDEQKLFSKEISDVIRQQAIPLSFDRIVYFTNFTDYGLQSPTYFNIVRDPFENVMSRMATVSNKQTTLKDQKAFIKTATESFAECWSAGLPECSLIDGVPYDFSIPYFCGHEIDCMKLNNKWALNIAKDNVDRYYPVVGLLEYLNETLFMAEKKLPLFFKGAKNEYVKNFSDSQKKWKHRFDVKTVVKEQLKNVLASEYDFYNWIKTRLLRQVNIHTTNMPAEENLSLTTQNYKFQIETT